MMMMMMMMMMGRGAPISQGVWVASTNWKEPGTNPPLESPEEKEHNPDSSPVTWSLDFCTVSPGSDF